MKKKVTNKSQGERVFFLKEDNFQVEIDAGEHTKQAVNMAVYSFLDDYYVRVKNSIKNRSKKTLKRNFLVIFEAKEKNFLSQEKMVNLKKDFLNELTYCSIREEVSKRNKRIREAMVAQFLLSAVGGFEGINQETKNECSNNKDDEKCQREEKSFKSLNNGKEDELSGVNSDPLGIAIPWEESHKKEAMKNKK